MQIALPSARRSAVAVAVLVALLMAASLVAPAGSGLLSPADAHVPPPGSPGGCHSHDSGSTVNFPNFTALPSNGPATYTAYFWGTIELHCTADAASWSGTIQVARNGRVVFSERRTCTEPPGAEQTFSCTWKLRARDPHVPAGQLSQWTMTAVDKVIPAG